MGSESDKSYCERIDAHCQDLKIPCELRVSSAHKTTEDVLNIVAQYNGSGKQVIYIAVAGRSNGLGPVISANTVSPVINCPPGSANLESSRDVWSSLSLPSGMGCGTVMYPEAAALFAGHMLALSNCKIWSRIKAKQLNNLINLKNADRRSRQPSA